MITRQELMKHNGLKCKNKQWSWFLVNHDKKYIVVQKFDNNKNLVYSPSWGRPNAPSHGELREYLSLVKNNGYVIKMVHGKQYQDIRDDTWHLEGYYSMTLYDVRLEIESNGNIYHYPLKDGFPLIKDLK